ncbi:hypothetical protein [Flavilitoribacter nigricans]|uniref:Uncharacterized protein n=1 Tax=Flavilitoribacter nigricans (strain ATCC 23147 / DSM 23189 / NBRC 102662 / NCIMB 1420 / SS-2) TaxID=1122177 RepID=A0A2D0N0B6_FLAN2|nr:hypothetical protein [Flavilitoribacter nigricans]PHN01153.1 hypothetical protein CRP01_38770 [Flavilitoribacter nigricans DSM 23189 = NBRC 102662]
MNTIMPLKEQDKKLTILEEVIEQLTKRLEHYSATPNAKQFYLDQQNETITQLHTLYKEIHAFRYLSVWRDIERMMKRAEAKDSQIAGHAIFIRTRMNGTLPSVIDKYW